jgi:hypothetical protein
MLNIASWAGGLSWKEETEEEDKVIRRVSPTIFLEVKLVHRNRLIPRSTVFLEKLTVTQLVKKFSTFMEQENSAPFSQDPATSPYPEPDDSNAHLSKIHFNIIFPSMPWSSHWSLPDQNFIPLSSLPEILYNYTGNRTPDFCSCSVLIPRVKLQRLAAEFTCYTRCKKCSGGGIWRVQLTCGSLLSARQNIRLIFDLPHCLTTLCQLKFIKWKTLWKLALPLRIPYTPSVP